MKKPLQLAWTPAFLQFPLSHSAKINKSSSKNKKNIKLKYTALTIALLTSKAAYADCTNTSGTIVCSGTTNDFYEFPYANDINATISGSWNSSNASLGLVQFNHYGNSVSVTHNGQILWDNARLDNNATGVYSTISLASVNNGTYGTYAAYNSTADSIIRLNLNNNPFSNNEHGLAAVGSIAKGTNTQDSNITTTHLGLIEINSNRTINDPEGYLAGLRVQPYDGNATINNSGTIKINNTGYYGRKSVGIDVRSYNTTSQAKKIEINNHETIHLTTSSSIFEGTRAIYIITEGENNIEINNYKNIKIEENNYASTSSSAIALQSNNQNTNLSIYNDANANISSKSANNPDRFAIVIFNHGSLSLENNGLIEGSIYTSNSQAGIDHIINKGTITGIINTGKGDDTIDLVDGNLLRFIRLEDGDDTVNWFKGDVREGITSGNGSDTLTIHGTANFLSSTKVDGADDYSIQDGYIDNLIFKNATFEATGEYLTNWENITLDNSNILIIDTKLQTSADSNHGTFLKNNSNLQTNNNFTLTGNLDIDNTSKYEIINTSSESKNTINGSILNAGTINHNPATTKNNLTINGDYHGNNGKIHLTTKLQNDNETTDKIIISGQASGSTSLIIKNFGGLGDQTDNGIHIIETGRSTAEAFTLPGNYVSAGVFEYSLVQRTENGTDNWYLTSVYTPPPSEPEPEPATPPIIPRDINPLPETILYTPNVGPMLANQRAANVLFASRLEDREGAAAYQQHSRLFTPWIRYEARKNEFNSLSRLRTKGHSNVMQLGTNVLSIGESSRLDIGIMGGYADYNSRTENTLTQRKASSALHGYSAGPYATWYANPEENHGLYVDTWLLWNHFDNSISTASSDKLKYKSKGFTASVEVGSDLPLGTLAGNNWWLQPQAQLIYQGVKADDYRDPQNVAIKSSKANYQTRLGLKSYLDINNDAGTDYRPYLAFNWIHNTEPYAVEVAGNDYTGRGMKNIGEVKLGLEGKLNANNQIWINTSYARGGSEQKDYGIDLGWRYSF